MELEKQNKNGRISSNQSNNAWNEREILLIFKANRKSLLIRNFINRWNLLLLAVSIVRVSHLSSLFIGICVVRNKVLCKQFHCRRIIGWLLNENRTHQRSCILLVSWYSSYLINMLECIDMLFESVTTFDIDWWGWTTSHQLMLRVYYDWRTRYYHLLLLLVLLVWRWWLLLIVSY